MSTSDNLKTDENTGMIVDQNVENGQNTGEVNASSPNIPLQQFWRSNPKSWFQLAEIHFSALRTTPLNRYLRTLSVLPPDICEVIPDLLASPPSENQYEVLKNILITRLAPSNEHQLNTVLEGTDLGDRKPSEALIHIRMLAGSDLSEQVIKSIWMRKMSPLVRLTLAALPETLSATELAKAADKMLEIMPANKQARATDQILATEQIIATEQIYATDQRQSRPRERNYQPMTSQPVINRNRSPSTLSIENRLTRIETRLDQILTPSRNRSAGQRFLSRPRSRTGSRSGNAQGICWFHSMFGARARNCTPPCRFGQSTSRLTSITAMETAQNEKNL